MATSKIIKFGVPDQGNTEKRVKDAEAISCVGKQESDDNAIIVEHGNREKNTVIEPVTRLHKVEEAN